LLQLSAPARRGESTPAFHELLTMTEAELWRHFRVRLRRIAVESVPGWPLYKQLREHVVAVLEGGERAAASDPAEIVEGGRISRDRVADAALTLIARAEVPSRNATVIAGRLCEAYFPAVERLADNWEDWAMPSPHPDDTVLDAIDGARAYRQIRQALGVELSCVLGARLAGVGFQEIADANGIGLATAHARLEEAVRQLRRFAAVLPYEAMRVVLRLLARDANSRSRGAEKPRAIRRDGFRELERSLGGETIR
jgi:hypothetical protein